MSCSKSGAAAVQQPDLSKRPNFTFGMVLGPDELIQEDVYVRGKHKLHNRALHGYGTVYGLKLDIGPGPEVRVSPGLAINPAGQEICVTGEMCARLNDWLASKRKGIEKLYPAPIFPLNLSLAVALCYRECETDLVPAPGEPCRTQQDSMAASRIADSFELMLVVNDDKSAHISPPQGPSSIEGLALYRPSQVEEDAVTLFGSLLDRVEITSEHLETPGKFVEYVRRLRMQHPDLGFGPIYLSSEHACERIEEAFRIWITEVRPKLLLDEHTGPCDAPKENCVLVGVLNLRVNAAWTVDGPVSTDETERPLLMHTRLIQEWILCRKMCCDRATRTFASACVHDEHTVRVWVHHRDLVHIPAAAVKVDIIVDPGPKTIDPIVSQPSPNLNVFDLGLGAESVTAGRGVRVRFRAADVREIFSPSRSISDILQTGAYDYIDLIDDELQVWASRCGQPGPGGLHDHDDKYAPKDHNHASPAHNHDALYSPVSHNHDVRYSLLTHNHAGVFAPLNHNHDDRYSQLNHLHDDRYSRTNHLHDDRYAPLNHTHDFSKQFVQIPSTADNTYAIVGAGFWRFAANQQLQPGEEARPFNRAAFNKTVAVATDVSGEFLIRFEGYRRPAATSRFLYIVKGSPLEEQQTETARFHFEFVRFEAEGVRIRLRFVRGQPAVQNLGFMVEVGRIGETE